MSIAQHHHYRKRKGISRQQSDTKRLSKSNPTAILLSCAIKAPPQPFYGPQAGARREEKGRLTEADTLTIQLGATRSGLTSDCLPPPSPHIFYRPDALPAAQPTASKH